MWIQNAIKWHLFSLAHLHKPARREGA